MDKEVSIRKLQEYIKSKDYKPDLKHAYFLKLIEEVGELSEAIRKDVRIADTGTIKGTIDEELYDVMYYVLALANLYGIQIEDCFYQKEALNKEKYGQEVSFSEL